MSFSCSLIVIGLLSGEGALLSEDRETPPPKCLEQYKDTENAGIILLRASFLCNKSVNAPQYT